MSRYIYKGVYYDDPLVERSKDLLDKKYEEYGKIYNYDHQKEMFKDLIATYQKFKNGSIIDLTSSESSDSPETKAKFVQDLETSLEKLQKKKIGDNFNWSSEEGAKAQEEIREFLAAVAGIENLKKSKEGFIGLDSKSYWNHVLKAFGMRKGYGKQILSGSNGVSGQNYAEILKRIQGNKQRYRQNLGYVMEVLLTEITSSKEVQKAFLEAGMENVKITQNTGRPVKGTIRATTTLRSIKDNDQEKANQGQKGYPLTDNFIKCTISKSKGENFKAFFHLDEDPWEGSERTLKASVKRYDLSKKNSITFGTIAVQKFEDTILDAAGSEYALALYRLLGNSGQTENGVALFLARKNFKQIVFGSPLESLKNVKFEDQSSMDDTIDAVIVNMRFMSIKTYLSLFDTGDVRLNNAPDQKNNPIPGGEVKSYIDAIHKAKIQTYLTLGKGKKELLGY